MTEKSYGGSTGVSKGKLVGTKEKQEISIIKEKTKIENNEDTGINSDNYKKAGEIAKQVAEYAKSIIKPEILLLEIAEKIEARIAELGGKPAFPCNLSINEIAAHYTPSYNDTAKAEGLLKIDFGVHIQGFIADTAFSLDLESSEENKKLILASEKALQSAIESAKQGKNINETSKSQDFDSAQKSEGVRISDIGKSIHDEITKLGFSPIRNLSGHELGEYHIHAGITIPNYDNGNNKILEKGAYAIEPFATTGQGIVYDGKPSGIYRLEKRAGVRDNLAREILDFIEQEYQTLPFCSRWIVKKFSTRALISLKFLEDAGIIYQYSQLIESSRKKVSQAEHTILVSDKIEVTTSQ